MPMNQEKAQQKIAQWADKRERSKRERASDDESRARIEAGVAAKGVKIPGPIRGGIAETLSNPALLERSREMTKARQEAMTDAKRAFGVKTVQRPVRPADEVGFAEGVTAQNHPVVG